MQCGVCFRPYFLTHNRQQKNFGVKSPQYRSSLATYCPVSCQELYLQYWEDEILYQSYSFPPPSPHNRQYGRMFYLPREMLPAFWTEDCVR